MQFSKRETSNADKYYSDITMKKMRIGANVIE